MMMMMIIITVLTSTHWISTAPTHLILLYLLGIISRVFSAALIFLFCQTKSHN